MSWMDSWSRPSKSQATPAPYYLLHGCENTPYCHSCGRVISTRKSHATKTTATPAKYCSSRCRNRRRSDDDLQIEGAFVAFLEGKEALPPGHTLKKEKKEPGQKKAKGDARILVSCDVVEEFVFGARHDPQNDWGRRKNKPRRGVARDDLGVAPIATATEEEQVVDSDVLARLSVRSGTRMRPSQSVSEVNGSVGGEKGKAERIEETDEMLEKRRLGEKKAEEREQVRRAARRGVVFGFEGRLCEAVMQGKVVEPSYAKGNWAIRWRE
ncbi:hypothetical protein EJ04DRAFT_482749 [Polyplosphaeria fusca]|uniref:Uncharacterized protein n=1 Tax=Polyplosphaeria fusca TaxID=682080 RepID=A0A9P4V4Z0_9PLEO|nr:hypothetical protein EJ04DRAFT_482749 [Polyplosphaeria fusca]